MKDFTLIKQLQKPSVIEGRPTNGIKYQEYELLVDDKTKTVLIPVRETAEFERSLQEIDHEALTEHEIKKLLRKHRGIRG